MQNLIIYKIILFKWYFTNFMKYFFLILNK